MRHNGRRHKAEIGTAKWKKAIPQTSAMPRRHFGERPGAARAKGTMPQKGENRRFLLDESAVSGIMIV
jgi:hypothetical protein